MLVPSFILKLLVCVNPKSQKFCCAIFKAVISWCLGSFQEKLKFYNWLPFSVKNLINYSMWKWSGYQWRCSQNVKTYTLWFKQWILSWVSQKTNLWFLFISKNISQGPSNGMFLFLSWWREKHCFYLLSFRWLTASKTESRWHLT